MNRGSEGKILQAAEEEDSMIFGGVFRESLAEHSQVSRIRCIHVINIISILSLFGIVSSPEGVHRGGI